MSRRGENIYKRKDGRWEGRFLFSYDEYGKARYKYIYDNSYTEVKERLIRLHSEQSPINSNKTQNIQAKRYTYWLNKWLESKKTSVKISTYVLYRNCILNHIEPALGNYLMNRLSTELLENFIKNLLVNGRIDEKGGLSEETVSGIIIIIKESFKFAQSYGVSTICNLDKISVKKLPHEMRVFSRSEQEKLIEIFTEDTDLYKLGFLLSLFTGIRIGELCALKWGNISLQDKTLKIEHTMQRIQNEDRLSPQKTKVIITKPKSFSSVRTIPLPDFLVDILKPFRNRENSFVLSGKCQTYVEPRTMQNRLKKYLKECNIDNAGCHTFRHTFCTNCIEAGFDIKTLSEIMGHSNVRTTLDKYAHSSMKLKMENMAKLKLF